MGHEVVRNRTDDDVLRRLKEVDPDIIVATNWRTWIPPEIFNRAGPLSWPARTHATAAIPVW